MVGGGQARQLAVQPAGGVGAVTPPWARRFRLKGGPPQEPFLVAARAGSLMKGGRKASSPFLDADAVGLRFVKGLPTDLDGVLVS